MKILKIYFILLFSCFTISAQSKLTKKELDALPNTIPNQFTKTYGKASTWHNYKMITREDFRSLEKSILDSVSELKKELVVRQEKIVDQEKNVAGLNDKINQLTTELNSSIEKENNISFLGIDISKATYNLSLWSIIAVLFLVMLLFIFKFKNSNILTKQAKKNLVEIEQEFELHRKKSIEKEQKLRRKLQDEINKQRGV